MIIGINELNYWNKAYVNVNLNLMVENVIEIKNEITANRDMDVKSIKYVKKIIFRILLHVVVRVVNI